MFVFVQPFVCYALYSELFNYFRLRLVLILLVPRCAAWSNVQKWLLYAYRYSLFELCGSQEQTAIVSLYAVK